MNIDVAMRASLTAETVSEQYHAGTAKKLKNAWREVHVLEY
jgi:hypothetical protein